MPPTKHSLLSASTAHRWIHCPPSAKLQEQFPDKPSEYAAEGSMAHELAEIKARFALGLITADVCAARRAEFRESASYYNKEMEDATDAYAELVAKEAETEGGAFHFGDVESQLDFSKYVPRGFGTADCVIIKQGLITVIDFKYGKGVKVEAEGNEQMKLYALGAHLKYDVLFDFDKVRTIIFQPRLSLEPSIAEITVKELLSWAKNTVKPAAKLAFAGEGKFEPGEKTCKFCKAKATCRARAEKNLEAFDEAPDPRLIGIEEAGRILEKASDMKAWLADLEELAMTTLLNKQPVPGWKLVEGRSNRKFRDEREVKTALLAAGYDEAIITEKRLLTLTALEKALGKTAVAECIGSLIEKPRGKPTLAPAADKRAEYDFDEDIINKFFEGE